MDSLFNILNNKEFSEPDEVAPIKAYVKKYYGIKVGVQVRDKDILLIVPSSAAANTIRLSGPVIKKELGLSKRLSFRING
jgi:hypothetical protein